VRFLLSSIFPRRAAKPAVGRNENAQKSELHIPSIKASKIFWQIRKKKGEDKISEYVVLVFLFIDI